ncbi:ABC transporter F family member 3 [Exophiala dermatitidis]
MPRPSQSSKSTAASDSGAIVVTSQQSRFHVDAVDAPTSKDIEVKDLTLSVGGHELLDHANLRILDGVHYVLAGRNGTGKSSLLRALAERRVPGVPNNLRFLLLGQTRVSSDALSDPIGVETPAQTILEHVTRSDHKRERLTVALEDKADSNKLVKTVQSLQVEQAKQELAEAQLIAARRSGARGLKARQLLIEKEKALEKAEKRYHEPGNEGDEQEAVKTALDMLEATRLALEAMDAGSTEARAHTVLLGLGFSEEQIQKPVESLSGGWRTRCDLACALVQRTDVLMLDEPTNFLDLPAIIWLERYIKTSLATTTVVVVTHDRNFADAVAQELILVRLAPAKTLEVFKGNLTEYEREKRRQIRNMTKMSEAQDRKTKHMEDTINKNVKAAKRTGDDKKLKQAASRRKKLEERTGLEVGQHGGRFKLSRDLVGYHLTARAAIEIPEFDPPVTITLPNQPSPLRHAGPLFSFEKVSFTYPKSGTWTLKDVDLVMHPGERVGLAGLNGSGKSTLVKLLMAFASGGEPRPTRGSITVHSKARFACYSQHAVEELEEIGRQYPSKTALSHLMQLDGWTGDEQVARGLLAKLGLRGNSVTDVPLAALSGGQRVRLALAEAVFESPHLLVLDEVTTHLDADTIDALIEALKSWEGALLVITHDRHFMRRVVDRERISRDPEGEDSSESDEDDGEPGTVYHVRKAGLRKLERGMQQYEDIVLKSVNKLGI